MWNPQITLEDIPAVAALPTRQQHLERARKNWDWLQSNWHELLPRAYGKFVAVANREAFVADTLEAALEWVRTTHPQDTGHIVEHVLTPGGPRIYSGTPC